MPFDEKPSPGQQPQAEGDLDEFSRLFGALEHRAQSPEAQPFASQPKPSKAFDSPGRIADASRPGEFTQIFRQIAKPTSQAPDLEVAPSLPAADAGAGEFTQFFSSTKTTAAPAPSVLPTPPARPPQVSAGPELPSTPQPAGPGSFTQIFGQPTGGDWVATPVSPPGVSPEHLGGVPAPLPFADTTAAVPMRKETFAGPEEQRGGSSASWPSAGGDPSTSARTQIFQMEEPKPVVREAFANGVSAPVRPSPVVVGPEPGEFTRLMQELNANPAPDPPSSFRPAVPQSSLESHASAGEFTRLMQGIEASPSGVTPMSSMPVAQPTTRGPHSAGPLAGSGEFTRLMQSLASPSAAPAQSLASPSAPLDAASVGAGESEFTRVMRGSSLREASSPLEAPPVATAPAAVAPSQPPKDAGQGETGAKSKKWLLILLLANLVLLVLLIVLAALFLRHR